MYHIVTGVSGSAGRAVLGRLQRSGLRVIGIDKAKAAPEGLNNGSYFGGLNLCDADAVKQVAGILRDRQIKIGSLVNIAGGFVWEHVDSNSSDTWSNMFQLNVVTAVNACRAFVPLMQDGAAIVNVGAAAATRSGEGMGAYAASKSGVLRLTESLSEELKDRRIRVNAVSPLILDTPQNRKDMPDADFNTWVGLREFSDTVAFLASDQSGAINGQNICLTGRM